MTAEQEKKELIVEMNTILSQIANNEDLDISETDIEKYLKISKHLNNVAAYKEAERVKNIMSKVEELYGK